MANNELCITPILDKIRREGIESPEYLLGLTDRFLDRYVRPNLTEEDLVKHLQFTQPGIMIPLFYLTEQLAQDGFRVEDILFEAGLFAIFLTTRNYEVREDPDISRGWAGSDPRYVNSTDGLDPDTAQKGWDGQSSVHPGDANLTYPDTSDDT